MRMASHAASIPPELFENILIHVGDKDRLRSREDPTERREEMKHLSACALTCLYWARLTRERMFERLVLRSAEDLQGLRTLLGASSNDRLCPIASLLQVVVIYHKLGDLPWFHNARGLKKSLTDRLRDIVLHILGPVPSALTDGNTRRSELQPLFHTLPRVLPMTSFCRRYVKVYVENIHFTRPTVLFNLLQDCHLVHLHSIHCKNLTWDDDATPFSPDWQFTDWPNMQVLVSQCKDNTRVAAMALSLPPHEFFLRPHLSSADCSCIIDIIRALSNQSPNEQDGSPDLKIRTISRFDYVRGLTPAALSEESDLAVRWQDDHIYFHWVASQRPGDDGNVRYVTHILMQSLFSDLSDLRAHIKTIDWDAVFVNVRRLPEFRGIVVQCSEWCDEEEWFEALVELVSLMREAWPGVDDFLQFYHGTETDCENTKIALSAVLEGIDRMRELEEADTHSPSDTHDDCNPASDS
ncbi:hypothetical protein BDY19DRAFT_590941 [Irpex rosettiformis]|uniref:Uncharacterized protein n=1 Tax=Irpex rosettiformis TaxID=378272 RepID=A0ACB8UDH1_9APHY|nr:hypothetical protein BDY19DRAFT_590941 [Irpex rosettiformis]